ncbi:MAG: hypothetical protein MUF31_08915 [Akkermansiaceae bacterium]|jgi:hypothetical protein|nr:hypothetical protein [Akkermansiaceae bacterium]
MKHSKWIAAAALGIISAGSIASAATFNGRDIAAEEKEGCSGKDGCKGKDGCDGKEKKELTFGSVSAEEKEGCSGKDGCKGKDGCDGKEKEKKELSIL